MLQIEDLNGTSFLDAGRGLEVWTLITIGRLGK